jgi:predicted nucleic acid-binding protein
VRKVLVDSSVWIDAFAGGTSTGTLSSLLDRNAVCINGLILAEIVPQLNVKRDHKPVELLHTLEEVSMRINWAEIIEFQTQNIRHGLNRVGLPDLLVVQNALQNGLVLYSLDKHFRLMQPVLKFEMA